MRPPCARCRSIRRNIVVAFVAVAAADFVAVAVAVIAVAVAAVAVAAAVFVAVDIFEASLCTIQEY